MDFIDSLGWSDVIHPGDVWDRAKRIFTDPIDRLVAFFKELGAGIIELIKTVILKPLAALASKTKAWDLLVGVLGHNPITKEPAEPAPDLLIGGLMKLAGQEDVWEKIQKANALQRIWSWFKKAMGELIGFVREVPGLFIAAVKSSSSRTSSTCPERWRASSACSRISSASSSTGASTPRGPSSKSSSTW